MCADTAVAAGFIGNQAAYELKKRVADLRAATSMADLIIFLPQAATNPHEVKISLSDLANLVFTPNHNKLPLDNHGQIVWQDVYRIKIIGVSND